MDAAIPEVILWPGSLDLPDAGSEPEVTAELRRIAERTPVAVSMIGLGIPGHAHAGRIRRNVLGNPRVHGVQPRPSRRSARAGWRRCELPDDAGDLPGLATANASLLDEATAAAEAMTWPDERPQSTARVRGRRRRAAADPRLLRTRAEPLGIDVRVVDVEAPGDAAGGVLRPAPAVPGASGAVRDHAALVGAAHSAGALVTIADSAGAVPAAPARRDRGRRGRSAARSVRRTDVPRRTARGYLAVRAGLERTLPCARRVSRDAGGALATGWPADARTAHPAGRRRPANICTARRCCSLMASMFRGVPRPGGAARHRDPYPRWPRGSPPGCGASGVTVEHARSSTP